MMRLVASRVVVRWAPVARSEGPRLKTVPATRWMCSLLRRGARDRERVVAVRCGTPDALGATVFGGLGARKPDFYAKTPCALRLPSR